MCLIGVECSTNRFQISLGTATILNMIREGITCSLKPN